MSKSSPSTRAVHSPLEINIGLHYYMFAEKYAVADPRHANSEAVRDAKNRMIEAGLLQSQYGAKDNEVDMLPTPALEVWVNALCDVPWPILRWVIPGKDD